MIQTRREAGGTDEGTDGCTEGEGEEGEERKVRREKKVEMKRESGRKEELWGGGDEERERGALAW